MMRISALEASEQLRLWKEQQTPLIATIQTYGFGASRIIMQVRGSRIERVEDEVRVSACGSDSTLVDFIFPKACSEIEYAEGRELHERMQKEYPETPLCDADMKILCFTWPEAGRHVILQEHQRNVGGVRP